MCNGRKAVIGMLEGRVGSKSGEDFSLYVKQNVLEYIPHSEALMVLGEALSKSWGSLAINMPGYRYITIHLCPPEDGGSIMNKAKAILKDTLDKVKLGLTCKVYPRRMVK